MKNFKIKMFAILALIAVSCNTDDVEERPVVTGMDAPELQAPEEGNVYNLDPDTMGSLAERFVWTAGNFGEGVIPSYSVEIDRLGDNFDTPATIGTTAGETQFAASHQVLNTALLNLEAIPFEAANFEVRVKAEVGGQVMYSNSVEMIITPYTTEAPKMYVVGNFNADSGYGSNWDPASGAMIQAPAYGTTNFEGYVYMNVASPEFKFLPLNTGWDGDYGDDGSFSGALAQEGESNITVSGPGYYWVRADTNAMTYSTTLTTWGIVGYATTGSDEGWNNSIPLTYNATEKVWEGTMALQAGAFKFRANNAWDINYGDAGADGVLDFNDGTNMNLATSGTYHVRLDLSNPRNYTYTLTEI